MSRPSRTQARTRFITGSLPQSSGSFFASAPGFRDLQHVLDEMGSSIRRLNNFDDSSSKWYDAPAVFKPMGSENRFVVLDNQLLYVSGTGYVGNRLGVGSISPSHKLDVDGDIRIRGNDIRDNSGNPAISMDGSTNVSIPNGTFGVGTTTAQKLVHIYNSTTSSLRIGAKTTTEENNALLEFTEQVDATGSMNYGASALYDGLKNKLIFRNHNNSTEGRAALTILRDGGRVSIGSESLTGLDQYLFVSGSKNSQGTTTRGTAVFGGDLFVSGSSFMQSVEFGGTLSTTTVNLVLSSSNNDLYFIDQNAAGSTWPNKDIGIPLSTNSSEWSAMQSQGFTSILAGILSGRSYQKVSGTIGNAGLNAGSVAGLSIDLSNIEAAARSKRVEVYLNGVLMLSGSPAETNSGICDYSIDTSSGDNAADVKFAMALDPQDAIIIKAS